MTSIIVDIMVEVLTILAIATKEMKHGRFSELIPRGFIIPDAYLIQERMSGKWWEIRTSKIVFRGWTS